MKFTRIEKDGRIAFTDGTRVEKVPADKALRERLIQLLEDSNGDMKHPEIGAFWRGRARDIGNSDEMKAACSIEVFTRLSIIWDELTSSAPKQEVDAFSGFGI